MDTKGHTGSFKHRADVLALHHRALLLDLGKAPRQIDAVVAVADDVVKLREKKLFLGDLFDDGVQDLQHLFLIDHSSSPLRLGYALKAMVSAVRVQKGLQLVVQPQQRHGEALHFKRRHIFAYEGLIDLMPFAASTSAT